MDGKLLGENHSQGESAMKNDKPMVALFRGMTLTAVSKPFLGRRRGNIFVAFFNAFMKGEIRRGSSDQIIIAGEKIIFQIKDSTVESPTSGATIQRFKIIGIQADYLECHTYDGTTEGSTTVLVAKQSNVRKSITNESYLGINWAVTYTGNAARTLTEIPSPHRVIRQPLFPTYETNGTVQNGQVWAVETTGGTGVSSAPDWLEIGPSRRWENVFQELEICQTIAGVPTQKKILVPSGDPYT